MDEGRHRLRRAMLCAIAALAILAPWSAHATSLPSVPDDLGVVLDGDVNALARSGDTVYLGGSFRYAGPRLPGLARLDADGRPDPGFPTVGNGYVRAVEPDGAGGWYVGGSFSAIGGVARTSLAHVLPDGSVDPGFAPAVAAEGTAGDVYTLARAGDTLYVGGIFVRVAGQPRSNLAAVNATTGASAPGPPTPTTR